MKVLAYLHAYQGHGREAGAETTVANLLESLVASDWEAEVLLSNPVEPYELNGVKVSSETNGDSLLERIDSTDVLLSHLECSERAAIVATRYRVPMVHLVHNTFWQTEGYLAEGCSLAVYNSEWVRDYHEGTYKGDIARVVKRAGTGSRISFRPRKSKKWQSVVVHPQIDPTLYQADGPHDCITQINLHINKRPDVFWEMARRMPHRKFLAVKGGYGEQEIPSDVPSNVLILSNTPDIRSVYARTRVLLMPSDYESFGRCAIEAAASGIPTVARPTDGLKEALAPTGYFAETYDQFETQVNRVYDSESARALAKGVSEYWNGMRPIETATFVEAVTQLAERTRVLRRVSGYSYSGTV